MNFILQGGCHFSSRYWENGAQMRCGQPCRSEEFDGCTLRMYENNVKCGMKAWYLLLQERKLLQIFYLINNSEIRINIEVNFRYKSDFFI